MAGQGGVSIDIGGYCHVQDSERREYVSFIIKIRLDAYIWTVYRRYSAFKALADELGRTIPDIPPCPPSQYAGSTPDFLERRRLELVDWMRHLSRDERVCRAELFHDFLRSQANVPPQTVVQTYVAPPVSSMSAQNGQQFGQAAQSASGGQGQAGLSQGRGSGAAAASSAMTTTSSMGGMHKPAGKIGLKDFVLLKVVGKGSFGKVMQVRKRDTGQVYAMKVLNKANIVQRKQVEHTRTERRVLGRIVHPFIVGLNYAFQTPDKLYFVLDYCAGGELFFHLGREGRFTESRARFYAAQITLALEHLHSLGILYRDLKPENVLLDHNGNVRLTDFGLSKENIHATDSGAQSFCGTPEYLAPEVLARTGHGRAVDWWSLGALLYEMLTGLPPFYDQDRTKLFEKIRNGVLEMPAELNLSADAQDLLRRMLNRDPKARLGCGQGDATDIKTHPFFKSTDWVALYNGRIPPPWKPPVNSSMDTSQFDTEFTSLPLATPESQSHSALKAALQAGADFEGFTYVGSSSPLKQRPVAQSNHAAAAGGGGAVVEPHQAAMWQQHAAMVHQQMFAQQQQQYMLAMKQGQPQATLQGVEYNAGAVDESEDVSLG